MRTRTAGPAYADLDAVSKLSVNARVDFYAIVLKVERKSTYDLTNRAQLEYRLEVVDESRQNEPTNVTFFTSPILPSVDVLAPGVIVRVHRATKRAKFVGGRVGSPLQFLVFSSEIAEEGADDQPLFSSSPNFTYLPEDVDIIDRLRIFAAGHLNLDATVNNSVAAVTAPAGAPAPAPAPAPASQRRSVTPPTQQVASLDTVVPGTPEAAQGRPFFASPIQPFQSQILNDPRTPELFHPTRQAPDPPRQAPEPPRPSTSSNVNALPGQQSWSLKPIKSFEPRAYYDLICQVVGVYTSTRGTFIRIWDGTKALPMLCSALKPFPNDGSPVSVDAFLESSTEELGLLYHVVCYDEHAARAYEQRPGHIILFRNLHVYSKDNGYVFVMHGGKGMIRGISANRGIYAVKKTEEAYGWLVDRLTAIKNDHFPAQPVVAADPEPIVVTIDSQQVIDRSSQVSTPPPAPAAHEPAPAAPEPATAAAAPAPEPAPEPEPASQPSSSGASQLEVLSLHPLQYTQVAIPSTPTKRRTRSSTTSVATLSGASRQTTQGPVVEFPPSQTSTPLSARERAGASNVPVSSVTIREVTDDESTSSPTAKRLRRSARIRQLQKKSKNNREDDGGWDVSFSE